MNEQPSPNRKLLIVAFPKLKTDFRNDADTFNELDFLLNRDFCHTYLVGALKALDTTKAVALLDFLTAKIRICPIKAGDKKAGIDQISRWVGAVIDAHPSTYSDEENAKMLMEALAVVQEKVFCSFDAFSYLNFKDRFIGRAGED